MEHMDSEGYVYRIAKTIPDTPITMQFNAAMRAAEQRRDFLRAKMMDPQSGITEARQIIKTLKGESP